MVLAPEVTHRLEDTRQSVSERSAPESSEEAEEELMVEARLMLVAKEVAD